MVSESFLPRQRMCVSAEFTLLSNSISKNFAKLTLCLRDLANLADIFKRS